MTKTPARTYRLARELRLSLTASGSFMSLDGPGMEFSAEMLVLLQAVGKESALAAWIADNFADPAPVYELLDSWVARGLLESDATGTPEHPADERRSWPIFAIGCHRSGTTLVRYLIDAHPRIACPGETKFISALAGVFDHAQVSSGLRALGCGPADMYAGYRQLINRLMSAHARRQGKVRWADKTPNYYRIIEFIDRVFAGQVLYVFIVRHPLDTVDSLAGWHRDADPDLHAALVQHGDDLYGRARYWVEVNERLHYFHRACPDRSWALRYEDLVADPAGQAAALMAFLGEDCPDDLVERALTAEHAPGYGDDKIRQTRRIHGDSVGKWRSWPRSRRDALARVVAPTARLWGYDSVV